MKKILALLMAVLFVFGVYYVIDGTSFNELVSFSSNTASVTVERYSNRKFESVQNFDEIAFKYEDVIDEISKGYEKHSNSINLKQYKISVDELKTIAEYLSINNGYYYVKNGYSFYENGEYVVNMCPSYIYSAEETAKYNAQINDAVNKIVQEALQFKTDIERLLYVHDYIVDNIQYDESNSNNNNIYGALVLKNTMCIGYSEAFSRIANKMGYKTYVVSSEELKHAWNMVLLDGCYYFVDCTWDDPVFSEIYLSSDPISGYGCYKYFMCSEKLFRSGEHNASDWEINGSDIKGTALSDIYDQYFWRDYESLMRHSNGSWFHDYGYGEENVSSVKDVKFSIDRILFKDNVNCDVKIVRTINTCWKTGIMFYLCFDSTLQSYNNAVYYMKADGIYKLTDGGRFNGKDDLLVFKNTTDENIYDFDIDAGKGKFKVVYGSTDENTEKNSSEVDYNIADYF